MKRLPVVLEVIIMRGPWQVGQIPMVAASSRLRCNAWVSRAPTTNSFCFNSAVTNFKPFHGIRENSVLGFFARLNSLHLLLQATLSFQVKPR